MILISKTIAGIKFIIRGIRTKARGDAHNDVKMSTAKTFVPRSRFEPSSDNEDVRNEIMPPINRGHSTTEVNRQDNKTKFNRSGKKTTKGNVSILCHTTVDTEQNVNKFEHREENNPSHTTIIAGDSILKHLNSHKMCLKITRKLKLVRFLAAPLEICAITSSLS